MQYSIVEGSRTPARPKMRGRCAFCNAETISRCGTKRAWHWSHKVKIDCDPWWETEIDWHRNWKSEFPEAWRETIVTGADGKKHVADVRSPKGFCVEFQHSYISAEKLDERERFHPKLVWVVDGLRLKRDRSTFFSHLYTKSPSRSRPQSFELNYRVPQIMKRWSDSRTHVYFDFGEQILWEMSPWRGNWQAFVSPVERTEFVKALSNGKKPTRFPISTISSQL